jgi:hypothetical protein
VAEPPPWLNHPVWGWPNHPHGLRGWSGHPHKPKPIIYYYYLAFWGWPDHPLAMGWFDHPQTGRSGGGQTTPWPRGWSSHPHKPKPFFLKKKKKFCGILGVAGPPLWPWGWFGHPGPGVAKPPHGQGGGPATPISQNLFFKKKKKIVAFWGWPDHPFGHGGGSATP